VPKKPAAKKYKKTKTVTSRLAPAKGSSFPSPSSISPGPSRIKVNFKYCETGVSINPGIGGTAAVNVFNLMGLFDPNVTGIGHQPTGFDQYMAIFEQYVVYGCRWRVTITASSDTALAFVGVTASDQVTAQSDPRVYVENGMTQWKILGSSGGAGPAIAEFAGYVDMAKIHGMPMSQYLAESSHAGNVTASPTEGAFLHVWAAPADGITDLSALLAVVELEFFTDVFGGKLNALS